MTCPLCGAAIGPWARLHRDAAGNPAWCSRCVLRVLQAVEEAVLREYLDEAREEDWWRRGGQPPEWRPGR